MAVLATDDFNRADNADLGANWDVQTGELAFKILSNQAASSTDSNDNAEQYNAVSPPNDQYAKAKVTVSSTLYTNGDGPGVAIRMAAGAGSYYRAVVNQNASNNIQVGKKVADAYTSLGNRTSTYSAGAELYLEAQGTTLIVKYGGTQVGASFSDSAHSAGKAGLAYSSENQALTSQCDDWECGDFSGAATTAPPPCPPAYRLQPLLGR